MLGGNLGSLLYGDVSVMCGSLLPVFSITVSLTFHFMFDQIILVRFRLLSGHLLRKSCSLG